MQRHPVQPMQTSPKQAQAVQTTPKQAEQAKQEETPKSSPLRLARPGAARGGPFFEGGSREAPTLGRGWAARPGTPLVEVAAASLLMPAFPPAH